MSDTPKPTPTAEVIWRVGGKVKLNVYRGDTPICQCHNAEDAAAIVEAMNETIKKRAKEPMTPTEEDRRKADHLLFENAACHRCHGKGIYREFDGLTIYETDSDDEITDHYRDVRCPDCLNHVAQALADERAEEREKMNVVCNWMTDHFEFDPARLKQPPEP